MKLKLLLLLVATLQTGCNNGQNSYKNAIKSDEYTLIKNCSELSAAFSETPKYNASDIKDCEFSISKKFDAICVHSPFFDEQNDWQVETSKLEKYLEKYKEVTKRGYYIANIDNNKGVNNTFSVVALGKNEIMWLEVNNFPSNYYIPYLIERKDNTAPIEHSFFNQITCIDTHNLSGKLSIKFKNEE